jgi:dTDP-4-amino-4,6-dideoxygalactose transaminase
VNQVTKAATKREVGRRPVFFYRSAREGMQDFLSNVRDSDSRGVLLPGFIGWSPREGSGVYDPVQSLKMRAGFYGLREDLTLDTGQIADFARTGQFGVLVVIHYFGRAETQMAEVRQIADEYGLLLVEDLAHAFFTSKIGHSAGVHSDMNLYSLHKMFPMPVGGMVTYSSDSLVRQQQSTMPELAVEVMSFDWEVISQRRRQNYLGLINRLNALPEAGERFRLLWPELNERDVPQTLPILISGDERDHVYSSMNRNGYGMVSLYHTLVKEVKQSHPALHELSRHIINFPIHQDVVTEDLDGLVEAFRIALRES